MRQLLTTSCLVGVLCLSPLWLAGCGDDGGPQYVDGQSACESLVGCGMSASSCSQLFGTVVVTQECLDAIADASCEEHSSNPSYMDLCFPPCGSPGNNQCLSGGLISICSSTGQTIVARCSSVCLGNDKSYTGTCAASFQGQSTSSGQPVCWCQ